MQTFQHLLRDGLAEGWFVFVLLIVIAACALLAAALFTQMLWGVIKKIGRGKLGKR